MPGGRPYATVLSGAAICDPLATFVGGRAFPVYIIWSIRYSNKDKDWRREEVVREDSDKTSSDDLDEYIRVSSPGLLIIAGAMTLVLVATVVWGYIGKIPVTTTVTGCVVGDEQLKEEQAQDGNADADGKVPEGPWIVCFVDSSKYSAEQIEQFGDDVTIKMPDRTTFKGKIEVVSSYPLSRDEARSYLKNGEWVAEQCVNSNYSWGLAVHVHEDISGHLFTTPEVTIITDEVPPIRFLAR